jgi:DNA-binding transcriptional regulator YiaG
MMFFSPPNYLNSQSAQPQPSARIFRVASPDSTTWRTNRTSITSWITDRTLTSPVTGSGLSITSVPASVATQKSINELRRLSGLTWEQLTRLFGVSRRSLHFWASGQPLSRAKEEQLNRLLGAIQFIDRGNASSNRTLLFKETDDGHLPFDLLRAGQYREFKQSVGPGKARRKPSLGPLSQKAQASRLPPKAEDLVDALQDPIHKEIGRSRPAKTTRKTNKESS